MSKDLLSTERLSYKKDMYELLNEACKKHDKTRTCEIYFFLFMTLLVILLPLNTTPISNGYIWGVKSSIVIILMRFFVVLYNDSWTRHFQDYIEKDILNNEVCRGEEADANLRDSITIRYEKRLIKLKWTIHKPQLFKDSSKNSESIKANLAIT